MTEKLGRNYRLTIYPLDGGDAIIIEPPFTIEFQVRRSIASALNNLEIDILNLSAANRNRIFQDRYIVGNYQGATGEYATNDYGDEVWSHNIILEIGYGNLYRVFYGRIFNAFSFRRGTEIVTHIESQDGLFDINAAQSFQTLKSGQTLADVLKALAGDFPALKLGGVGDFPEPLLRAVALNGSTFELLKNYSGDKCFIDNGKVYALKENEAIPQELAILDDSTGILETPRRNEGMVSVTMLMEPGLTIGQLVKIESSFLTEFNGIYKLNGLEHRGIISEAECGTCITIVEILSPNQFGAFKYIS